jgi:signal transduction histidine kinase
MLKIAGEIFVNALEHKRALAIESTQRQFLELLAAGGTSSETLVALVRIIQAQSPGMLGLISLLEPDGRRLRLGAGPGLPPGYLNSLAGLEAGPRAGSCGAAVHSRRRVVAVDIAADPCWEGEPRAEALRHGLRACWAEPIFGAQGQVLGAFAMYYPYRRMPGEDDLRLLAIAAHLAGIAIERGRADEALRLANLALEQRVEERTREIERRRQVAEGLRDLLAVLNSDRPLAEILQTIVAQAARLTGAATALLHRIDYGRDFVVIEAHHGLPAEVRHMGGFPLHRAGPDRAILERRPFAIPDIAEYAAQPEPADPDELAWISVMRPGYRAWLAIPLIVNDAVYGSLTFCYREPQTFADEEIKLAMAFGDQAALALENAALRAQTEQAAVVAERSRLARDLHDSVTQTLFSAGLIAEVLPRIWERDPAQARVQLGELRQLTRGALAEMRTLLLELRPATLTEASLGDLLRQLGEAITGRARVPVAVIVDGHRQLPPDVQIALYRIAQEALNNVAKHAGPCQATVHLACGPAGVQLHIADDGRSFDPDRVSAEHLGLGIMRERADAVGAILTVTAQPGQGTQIDVTWRDIAGDDNDDD